MMKYKPLATKCLAVAACCSAVKIIADVALIVIKAPNNSSQILSTVFSVLLGILLFICFCTVNSRVLTVDEEKIIFPRGADRNGKKVLQETVVRFDEIHSMERTLRKGDGFITGDCLLLSLTLKDGTRITVTLYAYGKKTEKKIVETIRQNITLP